MQRIKDYSINSVDLDLDLPQIIIQSNYWKFQIVSRFICVNWSLVYEDCFFTIKSAEVLKSEHV